jgi:hypothetical protein
LKAPAKIARSRKAVTDDPISGRCYPIRNTLAPWHIDGLGAAGFRELVRPDGLQAVARVFI